MIRFAVVVIALAACGSSGPSYKEVVAKVRPELERLTAGLATIRGGLEAARTAPACDKRTDLRHWDGGKTGNLGLIERDDLESLATGASRPDDAKDDRVYLGLDLDDQPFHRVVSFVEPKSPYYLADSTSTATTEIAGWLRSIGAVTHVLVIDRGAIDRGQGTAPVHGYLAELATGRVECRIHVLARTTVTGVVRDYDVVQRDSKGDTKVLRSYSEDQDKGALDHDARTKLTAEIEAVFGFPMPKPS